MECWSAGHKSYNEFFKAQADAEKSEDRPTRSFLVGRPKNFKANVRCLARPLRIFFLFLFGIRSMVGPKTLNLVMGVRLSHPEPI